VAAHTLSSSESHLRQKKMLSSRSSSLTVCISYPSLNVETYKCRSPRRPLILMASLSLVRLRTGHLCFGRSWIVVRGIAMSSPPEMHARSYTSLWTENEACTRNESTCLSRTWVAGDVFGSYPWQGQMQSRWPSGAVSLHVRKVHYADTFL
jgi:hypothetical protein